MTILGTKDTENVREEILKKVSWYFSQNWENMCLKIEMSPLSEQHNERKPTQTSAYGCEILEHKD